VPLTESDRRFAEAAVRRRRLFAALAVVGVAVAAGLVGWTLWSRAHDPARPVASHVVLAILILLNARQNLRQYRTASVLERLGLGPRDSRLPP